MDPNYYTDMYGAPSSSGNLMSSGGNSFGGSNPSSGGFNWGQAAPGFGALGEGLMGMFGGNGQNPANSAMPYYNQIMNTNQKYLNPYNQMGQKAGQNLQGQYSQLMNNPGAVFNQIGQSYHQSPGFQFALHQALNAGNNSAAAGGMAGSPQNTQQNMQLATNMGNQDYYNYMDHAMNMYGMGLQGEQGMYGQGEEAANNLSENISQALSQMGAAQYYGQAGQNQAQGNSMNNLFSGIGDIISNW